MDHSNFEDMTKGLTRKAIIQKLTKEFEILDQFQLIKLNLPPISYVTCVELEVLIKDMAES